MTRSVFITGGTGSVGQALVREFREANYDVVFQWKSNGPLAEKLASETGAKAMPIDFSDRTVPDLDRIDILVNNTAINVSRALAADVTLNDWDVNLLVNLTWPFLLVQKCLPSMVANRWGRVINISSIYGLRAGEGNLPYNVSKHGLSALTKTVAREYGEFGISSNEICPGPIESELLTRIALYHKETEGTPIDEYFHSLAAEIPSKRLAVPRDVARVAVFLAAEDSGYINGTSIPVDGGLIA
ncbi:MAG TPA: SDR family oxidoreductase [Rhizomicrobium sp.]